MGCNITLQVCQLTSDNVSIRSFAIKIVEIGNLLQVFDFSDDASIQLSSDPKLHGHNNHFPRTIICNK